MDRKMKSGFLMVLALALVMMAGTLEYRGNQDSHGFTNSCSSRASVDPNGHV